ncbi:hypothetical protein [Haloarcula japonica]|uniref:Transmembrane protein n=1 Tax=Haloarcula japonica (strain ATCC 49778 / DSM 6131 / JCM 7785 / NBRC 101032 / NCIMB 13157 / TR-1) TaxID=1227453 RepID=M0LQS9_HALJT|nr:hypothetical protein [Haloarcula japonica]EMA34405.1 hypothetical protein C444_02681 [Haloarcula japonica DSM 6131]
MTRDVEWFTGRCRQVGTGIFGDRYGYALWLGLLVTFGLYWRVGIFITDTYTTANALVAVSNGHLHITETPYTLTLGAQPGLHEAGGRLYGRNYGQILLAVPLVWALQALSVLITPRLLLLGLWSGTALVFVAHVSVLRQRHTDTTKRTVLWVGSGLVAVLFLIGALTATTLPDTAIPIAAFQISTMLAAATTGVVLYRLVGIWHDRSVALAAGVAIGIASSVGFWASLPKRHVLVGLLLLTTVYLFARSRIAYADSRDRLGLGFRAGAYVTAGLVTWTHAFEGFFLVVTLALVDLVTARRNSILHLAVVVLALFLGSLPMLVTNFIISGNPVEPPRLLTRVGGANVEFTPEIGGDGGTGSGSGTEGAGTDGGTGGASDGTDGGTGGGSGGTDGGTSGTSGSDSTEEGSDTGTPVLTPLLGLFERLRGPVAPAITFVSDTVRNGLSVLTTPDRMSQIFLRSGSAPGINYAPNSYEAIELTMVEAVPLFGAVAALPVVLVRSANQRIRQWNVRPSQYSPRTQTDMLVTALVAVFTLVYLSRLPLHTQLTVRYLLPTVPLIMYGVVRIPAVYEPISDARWWLAGGYAASTIGGLCLGLGVVAGLDLALGEAVQFHALLNLGGAAVCGGTVLGRTLAPDWVPSRAVVLGLGLPAGLTTAYLLLSGLVYFQYGPFALDFIRVLTPHLPAV